MSFLSVWWDPVEWRGIGSVDSHTTLTLPYSEEGDVTDTLGAKKDATILAWLSGHFNLMQIVIAEINEESNVEPF